MKKQTIRAIHVNPFEKTIKELQMPNDFDLMKSDYIKCHTAEVMDLGENVDAWFDEEFLLKDPSTQMFSLWAQSFELGGNVVLIGRERGTNSMADLPASVTLDEVCDMVRFQLAESSIPPDA